MEIIGGICGDAPGLTHTPPSPSPPTCYSNPLPHPSGRFPISTLPKPTKAVLFTPPNPPDDEPALGTAARPFSPMEIIGEITGDALGLVSWWDAAPEGGEDEEGQGE